MEEYHLVCTQENNINSINGTLASMDKSLEKMEKSQERLITVLEKQIDHGARLNALEDQREETYKDLDGIFNRVRDLEIKQASSEPTTKLEIKEALTLLNMRLDKLDGFASLVASKPVKIVFVILVGLIIMGTVCDLTYHTDMVKEFYSIAKK